MFECKNISVIMWRCKKMSQVVFLARELNPHTKWTAFISVSVLLKDTLTGGLKEPRIEPPTPMINEQTAALPEPTANPRPGEMSSGLRFKLSLDS